MQVTKIKHGIFHSCTDMAMVCLSNELKHCAEKGSILELSRVWTSYCFLSNDASGEVPRSLASRMSTFKEKHILLLDGAYKFIVLCDQPASERQTLSVPQIVRQCRRRKFMNHSSLQD